MNLSFLCGSKPALELSDSNPRLPIKPESPDITLVKAVEFIQEGGLNAYHTFGKTKLSSTEYSESLLHLNVYTPGKRIELVKAKWNLNDDISLLDAFHDFSGNLLQIQQQVFPGITIIFIISRLQNLAYRLCSFSGDERNSLRAALTAHGRDWNKAAEFVTTKDALHCQAFATLYDTPYANIPKKCPPFLLDDLIRLNKLVKNFGTSDWKLIAEKFGSNRKPKFLKFQYNLGLSTLNKKPWSKEEDQYIIDSMLQEKPPTWSQMSAELGGVRSPRYIRARWALVNPTTRYGEWTEGEKALLNSLVKQHGICWDRIAKLLKSRTSEECHRQWYKINYPTLASSIVVRKK